MKCAFVFPGQGSQSPGMMAGLTQPSDSIRQTFDEASGIVGRDLWALAQDGPADELNQTEVTQPAMLCAGIATWRFALAHGARKPEFLAGHSLGEYSALVAAGAITFADAVRLVAFRARVMQQAVAEGEGAMAAVLGLDDAAVNAVCAGAAQEQVVEAVNFNAPGQVVIAGQRAAVLRACDLAKEAGAKRCIELPVSVPSHCALMLGASEQLRDFIADVEIRAPKIPVLHNVDVTSRQDPGSIRDALVAQLHRPVRWVETIEHFKAQGVTVIVECGPGKVLTGLNRRIDRSLQAIALFDDASMRSTLEVLAEEA